MASGDFDLVTGDNDLEEYIRKLQGLMGTTKYTMGSTYKQTTTPVTDEELIFNTATLNDILTRLRQLEQVVSALLLAKGLTKEENHEKIV